jgi:hypothetical protein
MDYGVPYPNNSTEIPIILNDYIVKKTQKNIDFFFLTDVSVIPAFQTIIFENEFKKKDMHRILFSSGISKQIYNRARPHQIAPEEISIQKGTMLSSKTAYPSGHAFQSYYLARVLSIQFPEKKESLIQMARRISDVRIIAGLHFPSDRDFAWWLVDKMF